jgi:adenylate cyclase
MKSKQYEEHFYQETLAHERFKQKILASVIGVILLGIGINFLIQKEVYLKAFVNITYFYLVFLLLFFLIVRALIINKVIERWIKNKRRINPAFRYINSFVEVSIPSLAILLYVNNMPVIAALTTPAVLLYFIFIILSTLELDFKLSVFVGLTASIQYTVIVLVYLKYVEVTPENYIQTEIIYYWGRSMLILLSGIISGLVGEQIKRKIIRTFEINEERNRLEKVFGQQVSPEIVEEFIKHKLEIKSKKQQACIMFLDIRGFTVFCEDKNPEEIVQYQNDVFSFMIEIVNKHRGIINQILGDGFMATFGAPIPSDEDIQNAVNASLQIIDELNRRNENDTFPNTKIGIGLHAGEVVAGNVGTSFRKQYSITGNTVILASRLESLNKKFNSQILASKEVVKQVRLEVKPEYIGMVSIKGRTEPLEVYKLA